jgi:erythromycin esterase-like protein
MDRTEQLRREISAIRGGADDYDRLLELIGDAQIVLLGEASHGSHEFYRERARITRRLVAERGFTVVAVEADWPDAYRVHRWVRLAGHDRSAIESLDAFQRFPRWMWRNRDVLELVQWLREYNESAEAAASVGFYGLDLYSLYSSVAAVIEFLDRSDPAAARRARARYACFDHFAEDSQEYGYHAEFGLSPSCEREAIEQLVEMQRHAADRVAEDGTLAEGEAFYAEQNARLVKNAEEYYRTMFRGRVSSWNVRDRHMADTLDALLDHFGRQGRTARAIVWAHNSHLGDARATSMGDEGEWNVGQLVRERHGDAAVLVGFTTYAGSVTAADDWDHPAQVKRVRPAVEGSVERLLHEMEASDFLLPLRGRPAVLTALDRRMLERAIGVIYRPRTERASHYFEASVARQFDAIVHLDLTRAVEPLDVTPGWEPVGERPETYPSGV